MFRREQRRPIGRRRATSALCAGPDVPVRRAARPASQRHVLPNGISGSLTAVPQRRAYGSTRQARERDAGRRRRTPDWTSHRAASVRCASPPQGPAARRGSQARAPVLRGPRRGLAEEAFPAVGSGCPGPHVSGRALPPGGARDLPESAVRSRLSPSFAGDGKIACAAQGRRAAALGRDRAGRAWLFRAAWQSRARHLVAFDRGARTRREENHGARSWRN